MVKTKKPRLQDFFMLSDKGYADLKKAIFACTLTNLSMMLPFGVSIKIGAVKGVKRKIIQTSLGKRIIHNPVILVAHQKRVCVVPVFADNHAFGVNFTDGFSKASPKIMGNFVRNIKPPAINIILFCPEARNT